MNVFKNWAISVCGACLISALIHYFIPSFKFEKVIKIGLVAFDDCGGNAFYRCE